MSQPPYILRFLFFVSCARPHPSFCSLVILTFVNLLVISALLRFLFCLCFLFCCVVQLEDLAKVSIKGQVVQAAKTPASNAYRRGDTPNARSGYSSKPHFFFSFFFFCCARKTPSAVFLDDRSVCALTGFVPLYPVPRFGHTFIPWISFISLWAQHSRSSYCRL